MFIACRGIPILVGFLEADYAKYRFGAACSTHETSICLDKGYQIMFHIVVYIIPGVET